MGNGKRSTEKSQKLVLFLHTLFVRADDNNGMRSTPARQPLMQIMLGQTKEKIKM